MGAWAHPSGPSIRLAANTSSMTSSHGAKSTRCALAHPTVARGSSGVIVELIFVEGPNPHAKSLHSDLRVKSIALLGVCCSSSIAAEFWPALLQADVHRKKK